MTSKCANKGVEEATLHMLSLNIVCYNFFFQALKAFTEKMGQHQFKILFWNFSHRLIKKITNPKNKRNRIFVLLIFILSQYVIGIKKKQFLLLFPDIKGYLLYRTMHIYCHATSLRVSGLCSQVLCLSHNMTFSNFQLQIPKQQLWNRTGKHFMHKIHNIW